MKVVKRLLSIVLKTLFWLLLALVVFLVSLFFRSQRLPASLVCRAAAAFLPDSLVLHVERASFGFMDGFVVRDFRLYDRTRQNRIEPLVSADEIAVLPVQRRVYGRFRKRYTDVIKFTSVNKRPFSIAVPVCVKIEHAIL